ncbi:MAG: ABC transporter permease [Chloroflexi bacterium]|nr:ABC transporter permease [Chloroflexota bacterium]
MSDFSRRHRGAVAWLLLAPGLLYLAVFYVVPTVQMFLVSLQTGSPGTGYQQTWNFANYPAQISAYWDEFVRSIAYGGLATLLCFALGFPLAYFIAFRGGRYKSLLLFLVIAPFFTSFLLRTISWKIIFADNGMILGPLKDIGLVPDSFRLLATPIAVIAGITYNFLPFMTLPLYVALEKIPPSLLEASGDLYADTRSRFLKVTFPLALPGIVAGALLTFIPAVGDFVNAELLGNPQSQMIGNVIQAKFLKAVDYPAGAALSFLLMAAILAAVLIYARLAGTEQLYGAKA